MVKFSAILPPKFPLALTVVLVSAALPAWAAPVTVTVIGPDDKPLAGAQLSLVETRADAIGMGQDKSEPRVVAGENGVFRFETTGALPTGGALKFGFTGLTVARVSAPGMATETRLVSRAQSIVHLQPARNWSGVVLDEAQKPLAGVKVELNNWSVGPTTDYYALGDAFDDAAAERAGYGIYGSESYKRSAVTDAQGRWQFDAMPQGEIGARANVNLDDPRFVRRGLDLNVGASDAPPLFARVGATITGILVRPDGAPLADVSLGASFDGVNLARTGADGRFSISGVESGVVTLRSMSVYLDFGPDKADKGYIVPTLDRVRAVVGETTDVGRWQAQTGVLLRAQVVDAGTKEPIEGVRFASYGGGAPAISNAQGRLETRVLTDEWRKFGGIAGTLSADGYVAPNIPRPNAQDGAATIDLGVIPMERGSVVKGTIRVEGEDGPPASLPSLTLQAGGGGEDTAYIFARGGKSEFTTQAMKAGTYTVSLGFDMSGQNKDWEVVAPKKVVVPKPGPPGTAETDAPAIEIVVKRLAPAPVVLRAINGRVVDAEGAGIGGAIVTATLRSGGNTSSVSEVSDNDGNVSFGESRGRYSFNRSPATDIEVTGIERPGYGWAGRAQVETVDGAATISGLVLKKSGAIFAGRVVNEAGEPAAKAWVGVLEARDFAIVQADADGRFELRDLPLERFTLLAAQGAAVARVESDAKATDTTLQLRAPAAPDREKLAARALEGGAKRLELAAYWDVLGVTRLAEVSERAGERYQTAFLSELAKRDPQEFLRRSPKFPEEAGADLSEAQTAQIYLARASSPSADDRKLASDWLATQQAVKRSISAESVTQLLQLASIADKLGRPDEAADWLDYAVALAAQLGKGAGDSAGLGRIAARGGYDKAAPFVEGMTTTGEFDFWIGASAVLAAKGDLAGTKRALDRLEELNKTPEMEAKDKAEPYGGPAQDRARAALDAAQALAKTDATAALTLLPKNSNDWELARPLLVIADSAAKADNREAAQSAVRAVFALEYVSARDTAIAASLAQSLEPATTSELWGKALERTMPTKEQAMFGGARDSVGSWAFYHAQLDPARSRVLIEREWQWRLPAAIADKDSEYSSEARALSELIFGMSAVDPARALEIREEARAKTNNDDFAAADTKLAAAILATPQQRARLGVSARR